MARELLSQISGMETNHLHPILPCGPWNRLPLPSESLFPLPVLYQAGDRWVHTVLYQYSTRLETGAFDGRPADFVFMLLFNWICIVITGLMMDMQLLMIPLIMSVLYVWAQLNRETIVSFWFGTRFKACYLPWVILGFNYIIGGSVVNELIGNLVGHLYFFLMFKYPMDLGGRSFLSTPDFLYRFLPNRRGGVSGFGAPPSRRPAAPEAGAGGGGGGMGGRHAWGAGFRLGDD
ncbi:derlin-1 isoform X2 [Salmo salar]|uniref:Derlin n=1 Tax=Salmo salar TaxID=8030 RepID=A0ABM3EEL9_SALSA|nr:derlin-1 isoform X2 [Salmo salar]